jgi:hypothetical protein
VCIDCVVCVCLCVRALIPNLCDSKTALLVQILHYVSLSYVISFVSVEYTMTELRPTIHGFYCIDRDSSYIFRLCKVAIISLLISQVQELGMYTCSLTYNCNCVFCIITFYAATLEVGECSAPRSDRFTSEKFPAPIVQEDGFRTSG